MPEGYTITTEILKRLKSMTPDQAGAYLDGLARDAMFEALRKADQAQEIGRMSIEDLTSGLQGMRPSDPRYSQFSQRLGELLKQHHQETGRAQLLEAAKGQIASKGVPNGDDLNRLAQRVGFSGDMSSIIKQAWGEHQAAQAPAQAAPKGRTLAEVREEYKRLLEAEGGE